MSESEKPTVSIVMSVKNGMPFLPQTLKSIQAQTYTDWELVVVDNASTDDTIACLTQFQASEPRLRVFLNERDLGMSGGLNKGLQEAKADWVVRMDADDVMLPERLSSQLDFIRANPDVKVSCCRAVYISETGKQSGKTAASILTREDFERYLRENEAIGLLHPGVIMHRQTVLDMGGYRGEFWPAEDIDLWNRLAEQGHLILMQDKVLMQYRLHTQSNISTGFMKGRLKYEWVRACMLARRNGQAEPSWEAFMQQWQNTPLLRRLDRWRKLNAKFLYRQAGQDKLGGHYVAFVSKLAASLLLQPNYVLPRLYRQSR